MLLKKALLSADNLNNAFLSLTATGEQTINSNLKLNGVLTLKTGGSLISDNYNSSYMQIDPQGSHVVLFDGVNNQQLSVYSSDGSKRIYFTALSTENAGIIDVAGVDELLINTNSLKPTSFGGTVTTSSNLITLSRLGVGGSGSNPMYPADISQSGIATLRVRSNMTTTGSIARIILANTTNNDATGGYAAFIDGVRANSSGGHAIVFSTGATLSAPTETMRITENSTVGIGTASPAQKLDVVGSIRASLPFIAPEGAGNRSIQAVSTHDSISLKSHANHTWFRNVAGAWTFQQGSSADDWTPTASIFLPTPSASANLTYMELGQRQSNVTDGKYRGVRITKVAGGVVDGDLRAGTIYAINAFVLPVGVDKYATVAG